MNLSQMLYEMCHVVLSTADIKAISKSRGFSAREADSRPLFAQAFLTATGVAAAMRTLSVPEVVALHLLYREQRAVDVMFFERIYGSKQAGLRAYGTLTQQFKPIFDMVQRNLIRKGLLIITEAKTNAPSKTKMELWRYQFPPDFGPLLPPLINVSIHSEEPGVIHADALRQELQRLLQADPADKRATSDVQLVAGNLVIDKHAFTAASIRAWREAAWEEVVLNSALKRDSIRDLIEPSVMYQGYMLPTDTYFEPTPLPVVRYAFAQLAADEWIPANELDPVLDVVYGTSKHPSSAAICRLGWEHRCLTRYQANGIDYYRLSDETSQATDDAPANYLAIENGLIWVDLQHIPYTALEQLNHIATLHVKNRRLLVTLSITKMANAREASRDFAVLKYLKEHSAACRAILKRLDAQWGRLMVHDNLLVARITDLSLRVKLEKAFANDAGNAATKLVVLPDGYVAFPRAMLGEVERLVKRSEHVIKVVQAK